MDHNRKEVTLMRQQNRNKRKAIAGVLALQLVLQSAMSVTAFAEEESETTAAPATQEPVIIVEEETAAPTEETNAPTEETAAPTEETNAETSAAAENNPAEIIEADAPSQEPTEETAVSEAVEAQIAETQADPGEDETDTITLTDAAEIPSRIEQGTKLEVKGTVTSAESALSNVSVVVYDQAFQPITGGAAKPGTQTYDLSRLDSFTAFDQLAAGTYYFRVMVSNDAFTDQIVQESKFVVGAAETTEAATEETTEASTGKAADALAISGGTDIPAAITQGSSLAVKGIVTSGMSPISVLSCGIYDQNGNYLSGKSVTPQTKSYDLERLASYVKFSTLPAGNYTYAVLASNDTYTDQTLVRKEFKVGSSESIPDQLTLTGAPEIPEHIEQGESVSVTGVIESGDSDITMLAVGVYDQNKKFVTGRTFAPNASSFDISELDEYIAFDSLEDGSYMFAVIASNASFTNKALLTRRFTVGDVQDTQKKTAAQTADALSIAGGTDVPDTIQEGETLSVTGTVTSVSSAIQAVTVGIYDAEAKFVTGRTIDPKSESYDLSGLDEFVEFDSLTSGNYTYAVIASNAENTNIKLYTKKFTVGSASGEDHIAVQGINDMPAALSAGEKLNVTGTVTSASSDLTAVTVGVYDASGKFVTGKSVNPKSDSFDLSRLDKFVEFDRLPAGSYSFAVIASNAAQENKTLMNKTFQVKGGASEVTSSGTDLLSISGAANIPSNLAIGEGLSITGIVTSLTSNMTALTAGVYDAGGNFVTGKTINPASKSYDIAKLDSYIAFNVLPAGNYTFAVIASNAENTNTTLQSKKFTVGSADTSVPNTSDTITLDSSMKLPAVITSGTALEVTGTLRSGSSDLSTVTAGVYDAKGKLVTGKTVYPNAKSYDLGELDSEISFDTLPAGSYSFRVIASNAANSSYTASNQSFTVK